MFNLNHLHPILVHFPIALILVGFFLEVLSLLVKKEPCLKKSSMYLLVLGTIAAVTAWFSGDFAFDSLKPEGSTLVIALQHKLSATITIWTLVAASISRILPLLIKKESFSLKWLAFILFTLAALCVARTGFLGGNLVYNNMLGL
jgi:uncharacterized membrane protein